MARSTPTYTPFGRYTLAGLISLAFLVSDINYQTFSPLRQFIQVGGIYTQLTIDHLFNETGKLTSIFQDKKDLMESNKNLRNELEKIQNKIFLEKQSQFLAQELITLQDATGNLNRDLGAQVFKIASFDLKNYLCCSTHNLFLSNSTKTKLGKNLPVSNGLTFLGQTSSSTLNFIKVILFSDRSHILPVQIQELHCNARGMGKPMLIFCTLANIEGFNIKINDEVFTSGMGGVFPGNTLIGRVAKISPVSFEGYEIQIILDGNPLKHNYFSVLVSS